MALTKKVKHSTGTAPTQPPLEAGEGGRPPEAEGGTRHTTPATRGGMIPTAGHPSDQPMASRIPHPPYPTPAVSTADDSGIPQAILAEHQRQPQQELQHREQHDASHVNLPVSWAEPLSYRQQHLLYPFAAPSPLNAATSDWHFAGLPDSDSSATSPADYHLAGYYQQQHQQDSGVLGTDIFDFGSGLSPAEGISRNITPLASAPAAMSATLPAPVSGATSVPNNTRQSAPDFNLDFLDFDFNQSPWDPSFSFGKGMDAPQEAIASSAEGLETMLTSGYTHGRDHRAPFASSEGQGDVIKSLHTDDGNLDYNEFTTHRGSSSSRGTSTTTAASRKAKSSKHRGKSKGNKGRGKGKDTGNKGKGKGKELEDSPASSSIAFSHAGSGGDPSPFPDLDLDSINTDADTNVSSNYSYEYVARPTQELPTSSTTAAVAIGASSVTTAPARAATLSGLAASAPPVGGERHATRSSRRPRPRSIATASTASTTATTGTRTSVSSSISTAPTPGSTPGHVGASAAGAGQGDTGRGGADLPTAPASGQPRLRSASRASKNAARRPAESPSERRMRASHNLVEKQYRNRLNAQFEGLMKALPDLNPQGQGQGQQQQKRGTPDNASVAAVSAAAGASEFSESGSIGAGAVGVVRCSSSAAAATAAAVTAAALAVAGGDDQGDRKVSKAEVLERARRHIETLEQERHMLKQERADLLRSLGELEGDVAVGVAGGSAGQSQVDGGGEGEDARTGGATENEQAYKKEDEEEED